MGFPIVLDSKFDLVNVLGGVESVYRGAEEPLGRSDRLLSTTKLRIP